MFKMTLVPLVAAIAMSFSGIVVAASSVEPMNDALGFAPRSNINYLAARLVNELVSRNDALRPDQPIVVATPVLVGDLTHSNALAAQLQQGLMAGFHGHQFNVVDLNVAQALRVTPQGDFILSRDWAQLPSDLPVEHLVVSTMSMTPDGIAINCRIVDVTNNRVVSVAQAFVTPEQLPEFLVRSNKVVSRDGLLYRYQTMGEEPVAVIGDKQ